MKAQLVKIFIKAAAIVTLATSIANCGAMPEESITESTYQPTSENTDKTTNNDDEEETTNKTPSRLTEPVVDGCEAFGLVYDAANNTCVDDEHETNIINPPATLEDYEYLNFTVTPGEFRVDVSFTEIEGATSYKIERVREGSSRVDVVEVYGTTYGFLTYYCSTYSYKLVANMTDGSTVESSTLGPFKPTNCE